MELAHTRYLTSTDKRMELLKLNSVYYIRIKKDHIGYDDGQLDFDDMMDEAEIVLGSQELGIVPFRPNDEYILIKDVSDKE